MPRRRSWRHYADDFLQIFDHQRRGTRATGESCVSERVKNCHLRRTGTLAEFPDCVAARSLKHLRELTARVEAGERAVMLFVIQRTDCDAFSACQDLDPAYARTSTPRAAACVRPLA